MLNYAHTEFLKMLKTIKQLLALVKTYTTPSSIENDTASNTIENDTASNSILHEVCGTKEGAVL